MLNFKPILFITGVLLTILSCAMVIPALVDIGTHNDDWKNFLEAGFFTAFTGVSLVLTNRGGTDHLTIRETFVLTTFSWLALTAFAALPFLLADLNLSYTDAFFEAMSGITTTGATVITDLEHTAPGILMWRALLQWLGGVGIIVLALAILPILKIGGMQLFRTESSEKTEKIMPRTTQLAGAIGTVYISLTFTCAVALWLTGMSEFDAICHAMTTIATGGFSTHDQSIGFFNSQSVETIIAFFMVLSSLPYVIYIQMVRGKHVAIWKDSQIRIFLAILAASILIVSCWLYFEMGYMFKEAFRSAFFNVTSIMTTTGYSSADYSLWGSFIITFIFLLSVVGGCTGSTTGGIKIFRFQILLATAKSQINQLIQPHGIFKPLYKKKPISETITGSVMSFVIFFAFAFLIMAILLSLTGLDYLTSMSAAAATIANVGPALGDIVGPAGNYSTLSDTAKWILATGMLVGRLEIFTVLVLFFPHFWRD